MPRDKGGIGRTGKKHKRVAAHDIHRSLKVEEMAELAPTTPPPPCEGTPAATEEPAAKRPRQHDKPASGFSRGVDKFAAAQPERRRQEPSHSKLLHVRVMRSLSLRNLIREGSWISCPATPDALSSEAFSWAGARDRPLSPSPPTGRPSGCASGRQCARIHTCRAAGYADRPQTSVSEVGGLSLDQAWSGRPR